MLISSTLCFRMRDYNGIRYYIERQCGAIVFNGIYSEDRQNIQTIGIRNYTIQVSNYPGILHIFIEFTKLLCNLTNINVDC